MGMLRMPSYTLHYTTGSIHLSLPPVQGSSIRLTASLPTLDVSPCPLSTVQSFDFWGDYVCLSASLLRQVKAQLLLLLLPPPTPPSPLYMRKDDMIDTQVGIVAPFAYSVGGAASRVFIRWQKIIIKKKSAADRQSDEGAGSSRRLFILKRRPPLVSETSPPGRRLVLLSHGKTV